MAGLAWHSMSDDLPEFPSMPDLPVDVPARPKPPPGHPGGLEPVFDEVTEYTVTGMPGIERVRFGVIYDRGPGAAARERRQNEAILDALRWIRDHPAEVTEIKGKQAERDARRKIPITYTPVEPYSEPES
jgi:hypothetical protein